MRMIIGCAILVALWGAPAYACEPDSIAVAASASGDKYLLDDGRWERMYDYTITCGVAGPTIDERAYPMRWPGSEAAADSALAARATQMGVDLQKHFGRSEVDWDAKITRACDMLIDDDVRPSLSALIAAISDADDPAVGEMANMWRTISGELTWIQTTAQADSLLYRIADSFGMSGVGMLNYIKANQDYLE